MRTFLFLSLLATGGCHLIYPFDTEQTPDSGSRDARVEASLTDATIHSDADAGPGCKPTIHTQVCSPGGWCWQHPLPQGNTLNAIHEAGGTFFAVGYAGTLLTYVNGKWSGQASRDLPDLYGVWAATNQQAFAVGIQGTIYHYEQGTWKNRSIDKGPTFNAVWGTSQSDVYAVGDSGAVYHFDGTKWMADPKVMLTGQNLNGIWVTPTKEILIVGSSGLVRYFDGAGWKTLLSSTKSNLNAVWGTSKNDAWIVGDFGTILHFDGATLKLHDAPENKYTKFLGVWGRGPKEKEVYAVGEKGWGARYDGTLWTRHSQGTGLIIRGVWGQSGAAGRAFCVGNQGTISELITQSDSSKLWKPVNEMTANILFFDVWGHSSCGIVAMGNRAFHFDGTAWSNENPEQFKNQGNKYGVWGSSPSDVWAVGQVDFKHYDGKGWSSTGPVPRTMRGVWGSGPTDIWAVGDQSTVMRYDGAKWNLVPGSFEPNAPMLEAVWGSSATDVYAVGANSWLHYDGTKPISKPLNSTTLHGIWGHAPGKIWAVGDACSFLTLHDQTWTKPSLQPCGSVLSKIQLKDLHGDGKGQFVAVGNNGIVRRFDGTAWFDMDSGSLNNLQGIWGPQGSAKNLVAVGDGGTILWLVK